MVARGVRPGYSSCTGPRTVHRRALVPIGCGRDRCTCTCTIAPSLRRCLSPTADACRFPMEVHVHVHGGQGTGAGIASYTGSGSGTPGRPEGLQPRVSRASRPAARRTQVNGRGCPSGSWSTQQVIRPTSAGPARARREQRKAGPTLLEPESEDSAIFRGVQEPNVQRVVLHVEAHRHLLRDVVRVERHNVLETMLLSEGRTER